MLEFKEITEDNFDECIMLKVNKEQSEIIASNVMSLAQCYVVGDTAKPFLICDDGVAVGFILFTVDKVKNIYYIWRLMIDERMQRQGYGRKSMEMAVKYLKDQGADKIEMSHRVDNLKPAKLYLSLGFRYTGVIEEDEKMMELVF